MKHLFILLTILGLINQHTYAQSCVPYVLYKDDFGGNATSSNVGTPLPDGVTNYTYSTGSPVEDGQYGIRKKVTGHPDTWHPMTDHSGNGYMMVVNASYAPGLFYQKTISGLCQGTSFRFSAWVANLMRSSAAGPLDPNLKFVILNPDTHEVIGTYTTGALPRHASPTWEEYGIDFDLPSGLSSVILQIFNNAGGGNGNDLVLDDITFSICGPSLQTTVTGMYKNGGNTCIGQAVQLQTSLPGGFYKQPQYQWQFGTDTSGWQNIPGANTLSYTMPHVASRDSGWYRILVAEKGSLASEHCRIASPAISVHVWQPHIPRISTNSPVCEGLELRLKAPDSLTYNWTGPNGFSSRKKTITFASASLQQSGNFRLTTINQGGCRAANEQEIVVQPNNLSVSFNQKDSLLCEGETRLLDATNTGASYLWNTGSTSPKIIVDTGGLYKVQVKKGVCSLADSLRLYSIKMPKVNLGVDTSVCMGEPYVLDAAYPDVNDYRWQDGTTGSAYTVTQPGIYSVVLENICGVAQDAIDIQMKPCSDQLIFPTAFSPNSDGQNDLFRPRVLFRLKGYQLQIFNRWGKEVFHSADVSDGWDGRQKGHTAPVGAYIWIARYTRINDNKAIIQKGAITLIR